MQGIWDWAAKKWDDFVDFLYRLMLTLFDFLKDFLWWCLENLMLVAVSLLKSLDDLFGSLSPLQYIDSIPPEMGYFLNAIGFNQSIGMVVAALSIRFVLQLIPFVRLGS